MEVFSKANSVLWPIHGFDGVWQDLENGTSRCVSNDNALDTSTAEEVRPTPFIHSLQLSDLSFANSPFHLFQLWKSEVDSVQKRGIQANVLSKATSLCHRHVTK